MKVDIDRIEKIYGDGIIISIRDNLDDIIENIKYLHKKGFNNIYELLELNPHSFVESNDIFIEKVDNLITSLGVEYIEKINEDITLWSIDEQEI